MYRLNAGMILLVALLVSSAKAQQIPSKSLPRSTPEAEGVATAQLIEFIRKADEQVNSIHSLMVVRNGKVVCEAWWSPESPSKQHVLWSLSKSFTSTAVGLAQSEGRLSIDDLVVDYFPEDLPDVPRCI